MRTTIVVVAALLLACAGAEPGGRTVQLGDARVVTGPYSGAGGVVHGPYEDALTCSPVVTVTGHGATVDAAGSCAAFDGVAVRWSNAQTASEGEARVVAWSETECFAPPCPGSVGQFAWSAQVTLAPGENRITVHANVDGHEDVVVVEATFVSSCASVSGRAVTRSGAPFAGALVRADGPVSRSAFTEADGSFRIVDLPPAPYVVGPYSTLTLPWQSAPATLTLDVRGAVNGADLVVPVFGGRVVTADGRGVAGVRVSTSGATQSAWTDADGRYEFAGLPIGTSIFAAKDGMAFEPTRREVPDTAGEDRTDLDFVAGP